jgi:rhamnose transport system substrate-binding protein
MDNPDNGAQSAVSAQDSARRFKIGFVPKVGDLPYFNVAKEGAQEAAWDLNAELVYEGPASADAGEQIEVIRDLMARKVDVIAVSANDPEKLVPVLLEAKRQGIRIITWDADTEAEAREFFVNMVDPETLGRHLIDTLALSMGERGDFAILTASPSAANMTEWLKWMKAQQKEFYPNMKLLEVVPNDDDPDKAYEEAKALLKKYPHLRGIVGASSVGPPAAAQAVKEAGLAGTVSVVGLSTPELMRSYLKDGSAQTATLWSPKKLGYLTVVLARNLLLGRMPYDDQAIVNVGNIRVDGDTVIMGEPLDFNKDNVDQYDF